MSTSRSDQFETFADLDPVDAETAAEFRAAFDAIVLDALHDDAVVGRQGRRSPAWYAGAAAAAAAVVGVVIATDIGSGRTNLAVAEWSATPVPVGAVDRAAIEAACEDALDMTRHPDVVIADGTPAKPQFDGALIDMRGAIAAVVASTDDLQLDCAAHRSDDVGWYAFAAGMGSVGNTLAPGATTAWNGDASIAMIHGLAPDVTSVEFSAPGGWTGSATVVDGRFVGWLPSSFEAPSDSGVWGIEIRYLDAAGTVVRTATF